ncbi:hypothetical protein KCP74_20670 [Salmonella enterica subsp. enterica]|nr:hypothetical protein KCP74_20670 [Salmonella enterica subsp. enterica]
MSPLESISHGQPCRVGSQLYDRTGHVVLLSATVEVTTENSRLAGRYNISTISTLAPMQRNFWRRSKDFNCMELTAISRADGCLHSIWNCRWRRRPCEFWQRSDGRRSVFSRIGSACSGLDLSKQFKLVRRTRKRMSPFFVVDDC